MFHLRIAEDRVAWSRKAVDVRLEQRKDLPTLVLEGNFDLYSVTAFRAALEPLLEADGDIGLDFGAVPYIDSSGMGSLIQAMRELRDDARTLIMTRVSEQLMKTFRYARLDQVFVVVDGSEFDEQFPIA